MLRTIEQGAHVIVALFLLCGVASAQDAGGVDATTALHELFAAEWDYQMQQHPTWASTLGDRRWNDRWGDNSLDAIGRRHEHNREVIVKLARVNRAALSPADQLSYDLFKKRYETDIEGFQYRWYLLPLNQLGGVHTVNQLAENLRFRNPQRLRRLASAAKSSSPAHRPDRSGADALGNQRTNHSSQDRFAVSSGPDRSSNRQRSESESAG